METPRKSARRNAMDNPQKWLLPPAGRVDAVLDTDTYNEIDDQFALSFMMKTPEKFCMKAVYAAPFFNGNSSSPEDGMEKSYDEIINLLTLMDRKDFIRNVYKGSRGYLADEKTPQPSPAAEHLVSLAKGYSPENRLYVVAIGAITNVASALLLCPEIANNIVIVWLGGHARHFPHTQEFNMMQDIAAARVVFSCPSPLVQLPCGGTVDYCATSAPELRYWLQGKNALCDYLVSHTVEEAESYAKGKPWTRVIWDITAPMWLMNEKGNLMSSSVMPAAMPEYDYSYSYPENGKPMAYTRFVYRDAIFELLFKTLAK